MPCHTRSATCWHLAPARHHLPGERRARWEPCGGGARLGRLPWLLRGCPRGTGTSSTCWVQEEPGHTRVPRWAHPYPQGWFKWDAAGGSGATLLSHPSSWSPCAWPGDRCRFKTSHHPSASICPRGSGVTPCLDVGVVDGGNQGTRGWSNFSMSPG